MAPSGRGAGAPPARVVAMSTVLHRDGVEYERRLSCDASAATWPRRRTPVPVDSAPRRHDRIRRARRRVSGEAPRAGPRHRERVRRTTDDQQVDPDERRRGGGDVEYSHPGRPIGQSVATASAIRRVLPYTASTTMPASMPRSSVSMPSCHRTGGRAALRGVPDLHRRSLRPCRPAGTKVRLGIGSRRRAAPRRLGDARRGGRAYRADFAHPGVSSQRFGRLRGHHNVCEVGARAPRVTPAGPPRTSRADFARSGPTSHTLGCRSGGSAVCEDTSTCAKWAPRSTDS